MKPPFRAVGRLSFRRLAKYHSVGYRFSLVDGCLPAECIFASILLLGGQPPDVRPMSVLLPGVRLRMVLPPSCSSHLPDRFFSHTTGRRTHCMHSTKAAVGRLDFLFFPSLSDEMHGLPPLLHFSRNHQNPRLKRNIPASGGSYIRFPQ